MTTQPASEDNGTLLGVILDLSSSMRRNLRNTDGHKLPGADVILQALNKQFHHIQQARKLQEENNTNSIDLFVLGMGLKTVMHSRHGDVSFQKEHLLGEEARTETVGHIVGDLLALMEIIPQKAKLAQFQKQLNQKWQSYAQNILDRSVINEDVATDLFTYLKETMLASAIYRLEHSLWYRISLMQPPHWLAIRLHEYIEGRRQKIHAVSDQASQQYTQHILEKAERDFLANTDRYTTLIQNHLYEFVRTYTSSTLKALTLGFTIVELVEDLDQEKTTRLARSIQTDLEVEVKKHIIATLAFYQQQLRQEKWSIGASFDRMHVVALTERLIRKCGWDILKPLIESTVYDIFVREFEEQVKQNFPYWIQLASMREITKPLSQFDQLPSTFDSEYASPDRTMSGGTPLAQAIDKAALRFIDDQYRDKKKILIILSDGEFQQSSLIRVTVDLLKRRGVIILSCFIAKKNLPISIGKHSPRHWPAGAKQMLDIASPVPQGQTPIGATQLVEGKLCIQLNHSDVLEDLLHFMVDPKVRFSATFHAQP